MSRKKQSTKEQILDRALYLFNQNGLEAIGMRELARELNLSPGNLTYHFPKKEDIIIALSQRLSGLNSQTIQFSKQPDDLKQFFEMFRLVFNNQFQYRCLVLSIVHLIEHYPAMAEQYQAVQVLRARSFVEKFTHLRATGFLSQEVTEAEMKRLAAHCSLIGRFWLSDYWMNYRDRPVEQMIDHYLSLLAGVFLPYVTPRGHLDLVSFL